MGFGSYDESEQENQSVDTNDINDESLNTDNEGHDGDVEFEFDSSNEELLNQLEDMKDESEA